LAVVVLLVIGQIMAPMDKVLHSHYLQIQQSLLLLLVVVVVAIAAMV
jgi:hypothetical protein